MIPFLITISENEKRMLLVLLAAVILVFVLIGLLGLLVKRVMSSQAKRADTFMYDLVYTKAIKNPRHFRRVGFKKNHRLLFQQSWIPFLILLVRAAFLVTYMAIADHWNLNVFDYYGTDGTDGEGFTTLSLSLIMRTLRNRLSSACKSSPIGRRFSPRPIFQQMPGPHMFCSYLSNGRHLVSDLRSGLYRPHLANSRHVEKVI
jgi:hypothetical protein